MKDSRRGKKNVSADSSFLAKNIIKHQTLLNNDQKCLHKEKEK
jgi:hypothetical protein